MSGLKIRIKKVLKFQLEKGFKSVAVTLTSVSILLYEFFNSILKMNYKVSQRMENELILARR